MQKSKFGSSKTPILERVCQNFYIYTHPDPIKSVTMDPKGNLLINQQFVGMGGKPLAGYTVFSHEMENGKLLLRKERV